jgi:hypothetical protein
VKDAARMKEHVKGTAVMVDNNNKDSKGAMSEIKKSYSY